MTRSLQRIDWIDAAKGACILAVVVYHFDIFIYQGMHGGQPIVALWDGVISALRPLRMPLFFLISGYLASTSISRRTWAQIRTKKIASLLWVYVLWAVIYWVIVVHILPGNPWFESSFNQDMTMKDFIRRMVTANISLWYLYALVLYFMAAKLMRSAVIAISLGIVANIATYFVFDPSNWGMRSLVGYFVFFAIGAYAKNFITTHYAVFNLKRFTVTLALTLMGLAIAGHFSLLDAPGVEMLLGVVMVSTTIDAFALACRHMNLHYLCLIGRQTLPIYVMHRIVLHFMSPYMPETTNSFLIAIEPVIATLAITVACLMIYHGLLRSSTRARGLFAMPHTVRRLAYRTGVLKPV